METPGSDLWISGHLHITPLSLMSALNVLGTSTPSRRLSSPIWMSLYSAWRDTGAVNSNNSLTFNIQNQFGYLAHMTERHMLLLLIFILLHILFSSRCSFRHYLTFRKNPNGLAGHFSGFQDDLRTTFLQHFLLHPHYTPYQSRTRPCSCSSNWCRISPARSISPSCAGTPQMAPLSTVSTRHRFPKTAPPWPRFRGRTCPRVGRGQ
jgi:hypothetical protein